MRTLLAPSFPTRRACELGWAVQWAGPVVRTKSINDAEPKDRGDILIPTDVVIVKIHEDVAQARAMELAEENGLALLKGNPVDNREFYFQLSKIGRAHV